jgi:hypothetical protein
VDGSKRWRRYDVALGIAGDAVGCHVEYCRVDHRGPHRDAVSFGPPDNALIPIGQDRNIRETARRHVIRAIVGRLKRIAESTVSIGRLAWPECHNRFGAPLDLGGPAIQRDWGIGDGRLT